MAAPRALWRTMRVDFIKREDGNYTLGVNLDVAVGRGRVDVLSMEGKRLHLVAPTTTQTLLKLREAEYFFDLLQKHPWDQGAAHYHLSAFAAALYALPEVMDKECRRRPGYLAWRP